MVDNFKIIRSMLKFENPGDCYYVQLLRRQSDDPKIGGVSDPAYHGNMHSRSIKDYFISSLEHFDEVEKEIKTICEVFNVRAYIRLNKRTFRDIAMAIFRHITEEICSGETFAPPLHLVARAAGRANCAGKSKTWIVDVDAEFVPYKQTIREMVEKCEPFQSANEIVEIQTKNGFHLITKPFNTSRMDELWQSFCIENNIELPRFDIHKDNPTILYVK